MAVPFLQYIFVALLRVRTKIISSIQPATIFLPLETYNWNSKINLLSPSPNRILATPTQLHIFQANWLKFPHTPIETL